MNESIDSVDSEPLAEKYGTHKASRIDLRAFSELSKRSDSLSTHSIASATIDLGSARLALADRTPIDNPAGDWLYRPDVTEVTGALALADILIILFVGKKAQPGGLKIDVPNKYTVAGN